MKFAAGLPNGGQGVEARNLVDLAKVAEQSGWDGVILEDYLIFQGKIGESCFDPWTLLGAMAAVTDHILLGIEVVPLARRRPWQVASQAVTVDHLSRGRLVLGFGLGFKGDINFDGFGEDLDIKQRARRLDEGLEIINGLWTSKPFSHDGEFYHIKDVQLSPAPLQQPRIPIWIGGGYPNKGPLERALRWDGACMYIEVGSFSKWQDWTPERMREFRTLVEQKRGKDSPFTIAIGGRQRGEDWEKDRSLIQSLSEAGADWWLEYMPYHNYQEMRAAVERGPLRSQRS